MNEATQGDVMNQFNVGDVVILKAHEVLGTVAEPVRILEIYESTALVEQTTDANGEPGTFVVYTSELEAV